MSDDDSETSLAVINGVEYMLITKDHARFLDVMLSDVDCHNCGRNQSPILCEECTLPNCDKKNKRCEHLVNEFKIFGDS